MQQHHVNAFNTTKGMIKTEVKLLFPDYTNLFHLHKDASDIQLSTTLVQDGKLLGLYSSKLNSAQLNYTVGEKEFLGIMEDLKAFAGMTCCQDITIHI